MRAAEAGQAAAVAALLKLPSTDVNAAEPSRQDTPLILGARFGHEEVVHAQDKQQ